MAMIKYVLKKILSNLEINLLNKLTANSLIQDHYKRILKIKTYENRIDYLKNISKYLNNLDNLIILEFGVFKGESLKIFSDYIRSPEARFYGFDTFTGLPEKWLDLNKGHFNTNGLVPNINDKRISYKIGLFEETLPEFIKNFNSDKKSNFNFFIHFDADLFSSTYLVLNLLSSFIDEYYFSFDEFPSDEVRALYQFEISKKCQIDFFFKQKKSMSIPVARVFGKLTNHISKKN